MEIRNISPLGDLDVVLLERIVAAGEVVDVTDDQALELCAGLASFEPVDAEAFAALLPPEPEPEPEPPADPPADATDEPPAETPVEPELDETPAPAGRRTKTKEA